MYSPVAIAGDFNAWAVDWGSKATNTRGCLLLEAMALLDVVLLNTGNKPTFTRGEASSIVDLTFVSSTLAKGNSSWEVSDTYTASDHSAIYWEVSRNPTANRVPHTRPDSVGWRVSTYDPDVFKIALEDRPLLDKSANEKAADMIRRLTEACDAAMPRRRSNQRSPPVYWWNDNISELRSICVKARRTSQRARKTPLFEQLYGKYKKARLKLNKAIKESKRNTWTTLLEEVEKDPWGKPYQIVVKQLKQGIAMPTCPILLRKIVSTLFPKQPKSSFQLRVGETEEIPPITEKELILACGRVGNNKAPGPDGIPNVALKQAVKETPRAFLETYNSCLLEGTFPILWKRQKLVLIPKGNKPIDEPSSYRPLCMLDTAGKILERIIHNRIEAAIEPHLADSQYGFRKGRSTLDAIEQVVSTAKQAVSGKRWKRGSKKYCLVATLDIKNAFNSAKWDVILEALNSLKVPLYLRKIVASYFSDRVLTYTTQTGREKYKVTGGVPQGSVLGPLLWNVMYDGLLKMSLPSETKLVAFADDLAIVIVVKYLEEVKWAFEKSFQIITRWMKSVGLELAEQKTEAVLITGRKVAETITLNVGNYEIVTQPAIRYLGVMIDHRLNFKDQVERAATKASMVTAKLCRLMPNVGGPKQNRRKLLASVTTSVLMYGAPIYSDVLSKQEYRRKLVAVYRISTLRVASAFRTVSEDAACVIAGMVPVAILADERKNLHQSKKCNPNMTAAELRNQGRLKSLQQWQSLWDKSTKGRWTRKLIPGLEPWVNRKHGELNYYLTQMLSGHGCYRAYLHRFKYEDSPDCPNCVGITEDAEHVFFVCPRFNEARKSWEEDVGCKVYPETMIATMLSSASAWELTSTYATTVLKELRKIERERKKLA